MFIIIIIRMLKGKFIPKLWIEFFFFVLIEIGTKQNEKRNEKVFDMFDHHHHHHQHCLTTFVNNLLALFFPIIWSPLLLLSIIVKCFYVIWSANTVNSTHTHTPFKKELNARVHYGFLLLLLSELSLFFSLARIYAPDLFQWIDCVSVSLLVCKW